MRVCSVQDSMSGVVHVLYALSFTTCVMCTADSNNFMRRNHNLQSNRGLINPSLACQTRPE